MLNLGFTEILVVLAVLVVVVGPDRLPEVVRWLGRQYGKLMRASEELRRAFVIEAEQVESDERVQVLEKRREEARERIAAARAAAEQSTAVPQPREMAVPQGEALEGSPVEVASKEEDQDEETA